MRCRRRGHHRDSRHGVDPVDRGGQAGPSPGASAPTPTVQLYMPDGQLKSHSLRVYVTHELREEHNPQLRLLGGHAVTEGTSGEGALRTPIIVSSGQVWSETVNGEQITRSGTLLLFATPTP